MPENHGVVIADHRNHGATLDPADFGAAAITSNVGTVSPDATLGVRLLGVTTGVRADRALGNTRSQFRIRFSVLDGGNDGVDDFAQLSDGENSGAGTLPLPVLTYQ